MRIGQINKEKLDIIFNADEWKLWQGKKTVRKDLSGLPSSGRSLLCLSYHVHTDCNFWFFMFALVRVLLFKDCVLL